MFVKNADTVIHSWVGQVVSPGAYYQITDRERTRWQNNSPFIKDIANSLAVMATDTSGSGDILDINKGINFLKELTSISVPDYSDILYKEVASESEDASTGVVIPNGQTVAVTRFKGNGLDPTAYVMCVFDRGGGSEKILGVIKGEDDVTYDPALNYTEVTGDGSALLQVILVNNNTQSAAIGGLFEALIV